MFCHWSPHQSAILFASNGKMSVTCNPLRSHLSNPCSEKATVGWLVRYSLPPGRFLPHIFVHLGLEGSLWYQEQGRNVGALFDSLNVVNYLWQPARMARWDPWSQDYYFEDLLDYRQFTKLCCLFMCFKLIYGRRDIIFSAIKLSCAERSADFSKPSFFSVTT